MFWLRMSPISTRICVPNLVAVRRSCRKKMGGTDRQTKKTAAFIVDEWTLDKLIASLSAAI